jgi:hypothetical protein
VAPRIAAQVGWTVLRAAVRESSNETSEAPDVEPAAVDEFRSALNVDKQTSRDCYINVQQTSTVNMGHVGLVGSSFSKR